MKDGYISDERVWDLMKEQDVIARTYYEERAAVTEPTVGLVRSVEELQSVVDAAGAAAGAGAEAEEGVLASSQATCRCLRSQGLFFLTDCWCS